MMKRLGILGLGLASFATMATNAFAAATTGADAEVMKWRIISSAFALAIAAAAGAFSQSRSIASALDGTARNPGAGGDLRVSMIIGLALIESLVIYTFVICLIIIL
ncbi:MAG: ATP synthase F0 subunit C [Nitrospinaceae bacterium]|nr:ATP synthase F0 subunit C [Nitrospinaceae bacterium]MBT3432809.1 ATP synthase F0 subunit C [Nitrospinaceae bacterium]MBT3822268.1 ATP synthase F0 subunit C [Nitrospinaceae bacterium]MBT4093876.1 ATP synthase F0 subunit C [Nitrospinaceae bacterium]MBT4432138.1 ATP synthase F0 subunit C [Nitrospinaceae bacterium]